MKIKEQYYNIDDSYVCPTYSSFFWEFSVPTAYFINTWESGWVPRLHSKNQEWNDKENKWLYGWEVLGEYKKDDGTKYYLIKKENHTLIGKEGILKKFSQTIRGFGNQKT